MPLETGEFGADTGEGSDGSLPNPDPTFDSAEDGTLPDSGDEGPGNDDAPMMDDGDDATTSTGGDDDASADTDSTSGDTDDDSGLDAGEATGTTDGGTDDAGTDDAGTDEGEETTGSAAQPIDLSGYTISQTNSARSFEFPPGTVLEPGMLIVIGRDAGQAAFENFWGSSMGDDVLYFDTQDEFPAINGGETFSLVDDDAQTVEGPTALMELGDNMQRVDASIAANDNANWEISSNPNAVGTPGSAPPAAAADAALVISEMSDTTGSGAFVYEFVELAYVAP